MDKQDKDNTWEKQFYRFIIPKFQGIDTYDLKKLQF